MGTSRDNLSFNDHVRYPSASTLTIYSDNHKFTQQFNRLFTTIYDYKTGNIQPPNYNPVSLFGVKTCGQFAQSLFEQAGMEGIEIPFFPDEALKKIKKTG